jgi:hypothetical protein
MVAGQAAFLHRGPVQLQVGSGGLQHGGVVIGGPLKHGAHVVAVGLQGPAAVAGQKGDRCQLIFGESEWRLSLADDLAG